MQAHFALGRLAKRYGVTKREMIERLVIAEDDRICAAAQTPQTGAMRNNANLRVTLRNYAI